MPKSKLVIITILSLLIFSTFSAKSCDSSVDSHSTGADPNDPHICTCVTNYIFKPSIHKCVKDCNLIAQAKSNCLQSPTNIDTCDCNDGYYWGISSLICGRICTVDQNSLGTYNTLNISSCNCKPTFIWDATQDKCVKFCQVNSTTHIIGLSQTDITQCKCDNNYIYSSSINSCILPCNGDTHADSNNNCECIAGYIKNSNGICVKNCVDSQTTTANLDPNDINKCQCKQGFIWPTDPSLLSLDMCAIDCSNIQNSPHTNMGLLSCMCDPNFQFLANSCQLQCGVIEFAIGNNANNNSMCDCSTNYIWSTNQYPNLCSINCEQKIKICKFG